MGTGLRARTAIGQPGQAVVAIAAQPVVDGLAGHAIADCDVGHRRPVEDFDDRLQALLHQTQLHQHRGPPSFLRTWTSPAKKVAPARWWTSRHKCQAGTGASVAQVPDPRREVSGSYRSHGVKDEPDSHTASEL